MSDLYVKEIPGKTGPESGEIHHFPTLDATRYVYYDQKTFPKQFNATNCAKALITRFEEEKNNNTVHTLRDFCFYLTKAMDKVNNPSGHGFITIEFNISKNRFYMEKLH